MIPQALTELFSTVAATSWRAAWLILALIALRRLVRGRIPAQVWFVVWIVVALRLLLPFSLPASWSPFNLLPVHAAASRPLLTPSASTPEGVVASVPIAPAVMEPVASASVAPVGNAPMVATPPPSLPSGSTAPEPMSPKSQGWSTWEIGTVLWLAGAAVLALTRLVALARFHRRLRRLSATSDARLIETVTREARQLGGTGAPTCLETDAVDAPALFGVIRPRLLFPPGLTAQLSDDELRLVVRHELAHWRRRDLLAQALLQAAAIVHWFNPLAWFAARLARNDCELACDEFVLRREAAGSATAYGSTLLKVLGVTPRLRRRPAASVGIFESKQQLAQRVRTIAGYRASTRAGLLGGVALVAVLAIASLTRESRAAASVPADSKVAAENAGDSASPDAGGTAAGAVIDRGLSGATADSPSAALDPKLLVARAYNIQERRKQGLSLADLHFVAADPRVAPLREKVAVQKAEIEKMSAVDTDAQPRRNVAENRLQHLEADLQHAVEAVCREIETAYAEVAARQEQARRMRSTVFAAQAAQDRARRIQHDQGIADAQRQAQLADQAYRARYSELIQARRDAEILSSRRVEIKRQEQAKKPLADLPFIASQQLVTRLKEELVNGRIEGAALQARYAESHPDVVAWQKRMRQVEIELSLAVTAAVDQIETSARSSDYQMDLFQELTDAARGRLRSAEEQLGKLRTEAEDAASPGPISASPAASPSIVVRIMGAVNQQGMFGFPSHEKPIILDVVAQAGGFTPRADRLAVRVVSVAADGKRSTKFIGRDAMQDTTALASGDIVIVPEQNESVRELAITGAVHAPGIYPFPEGGGFSLVTLFAKVGGPTPTADLRNVTISRRLGGGSSYGTVDLSGLLTKDAKDLSRLVGYALQPGDEIFVPERKR